jgi:hypothetical protein
MHAHITVDQCNIANWREVKKMKIPACLLYVGTEDGVRTMYLGSDGTMTLKHAGLHGNAVRGIAVHPYDPRIAYVACGLRGWGLHVTEDAGQSFETLGLNGKWVWDVAVQPSDPSTIWIGTEPPMLYVSYDGCRTFHPQDSLEYLPSRTKWHFFHAPFYAGHIHGITMSRNNPKRIYAGVEQGGLIYSCDGGVTWNDTLIGKDIHRIAIKADDPDTIFAGAGDGLFVSHDGGLTWREHQELKGKYIHSIQSDPTNPDCMYIYADDANCPLFRSFDGGHHWSPIGKGLPSAKPADSLVLHPANSNVLIYGADTGHRVSSLFISYDQGDTWECLFGGLPKIWRMKITLIDSGVPETSVI